MIEAEAGVLEGGIDVLALEVRKLLQDVRPLQASGQEIQDVDHADAHVPNTGTATALLGIEGDATAPIDHGFGHLP